MLIINFLEVPAQIAFDCSFKLITLNSNVANAKTEVASQSQWLIIFTFTIYSLQNFLELLERLL